MWRAAVFLLLAGLVGGCSGKRESTDTGTTTEPPDYAYPTEAEFCAAMAQAECSTSVVKACYGSDDATLTEDTAQCVEARTARCNPDALPYNPELAEGCIEARKKALADAVWTHAELDEAAKKCLPVFSKEGPEGALCQSSYDCDTAKGLVCIIKLGSFDGVCELPVTTGGGESCADPAAVCDEGFYCDPGTEHCLALLKENDVCSASAPCAVDFYCTSPEDGICTLKTKNGLDCQLDELCAGGFCLGATDMKPGVCSSTLPLQINADSCEPYRQ